MTVKKVILVCASYDAKQCNDKVRPCRIILETKRGKALLVAPTCCLYGDESVEWDVVRRWA